MVDLLLKKILIKAVFVYVAGVNLVLNTDISNNEPPSLGYMVLISFFSFVFSYGMYAMRRDIVKYLRDLKDIKNDGRI